MLQFEKVKNGHYTVKNLRTNKYLYSKYKPEAVKLTFKERLEVDYILVLGLGYEAIEICKNTSKKVIVLEADDRFKSYAQISEDMEVYYLSELPSNIFFSGIPQIIINKEIFSLHENAYKKILKYLFTYKSKEEIWVIEEPFLSKAIYKELTNIGYLSQIVNKDKIFETMKKMNKIPDYILSINYSPAIANIAQKLNLKYIAWNVDSPWLDMFSEGALDYKNSIIFDFDRGMVDKVKKELGKDIYYLPLAGKLAGNLSFDEDPTYQCDISFIGHSSVNNQLIKAGIAANVPFDVMLQVSDLILQQKKAPIYKLEQLATDELFDLVHSNQSVWSNYFSHLKKRDAIAFDIAKLTSHKERVELANFLSSYSNFSLYGDPDWLAFLNNKVCYKGIAGYETEIYKIIKNSKININDTRTFFRDSLPLRIFEILSCGGFCVTNYKEHANKIFEDGKHLVSYRDLQDLEEIIDYYLVHTEERQLIQQQGYEYLMKHHTLKMRLQEMLSKAEEVFYMRGLQEIEFIKKII